MTGLAPPHDWWNAETATPPVLDTLAAAGYRVVRWLVKVGMSHSETWRGFQNCRSAQKIQASPLGGDAIFRHMRSAPACSLNREGADREHSDSAQ